MMRATNARRARAGTALGLAGLLLAAGGTRTEPLRWTHPDPAGVAGFRIHYGTRSGSYPSLAAVGVPRPDAQGVFHWDLVVPADMDLHVVVTAVDARGVESAFSNEQVRPAPAPSAGSGGSAAPPPGTPPPTSGSLGPPGQPTLVGP